MNKKITFLILALFALISGPGWAEVVSGTTYETESTSSLPNGWTGNGGGSSYIQLISSSNHITTDNFIQNGFTSIVLKARKYGGPSAAQALITVSWYDAATSNETVLGTIAPENTTLTNYTISSPAKPTGNTSGYIKIQCKGASSSKGSGVSQVTITYTAGSSATLESISIKTPPTTISYKEGDFFDPTGLVITKHFVEDDAEDEDVAYSQATASQFSFNPTLETALTDNTSVTITYGGESTTQAISVHEPYTYNITWMANGEQFTTTQVTEGNEIGTLPTPDAANIPNDFEFAGWSSSESSTATIGETYIVNADVTLYAVFSREEGGIPGSGNYEKVTAQLTDWRGNYLIAYSSTIFADGRVGGTGGLGKQNQKVNPENNLSDDENTVSAQWGDTYHVTLENIEESNTYLLKTQDGKYNYQSSNANGLASTTSRETAAQYPITVNFASENEINLALGGNATGAVFRYNTDGYFRYYKNCGQSEVYFYKKDEGTPGTLHYYTRVYDENTELASLEVAGPSIILSGYTLTVTGTLTNSVAANLIIEDGGQLICNNEVDATVKKSISAINGNNGWYTIASPVNGSIGAPTAMTSSNEYDLYYYDEPTYTWKNYENQSFELANRKGYLYANGTATDIEFAGTLRAGNEKVVVDLSYESTYQKLKGFNLVGNPFAHNIIMGTNAIMTNENTSYYVVENGANLVAKTSATPIKPCQGFMVQATGEDQKITFNPGAKETQTEHEYITIAAGNGDFMDMAYICTNADEKLGKITLDNPTAKVYLQQNGNDYAIAPLGEATSMVVCFKAPASGTYTINVSSDREGVSLKDMKTGYVTYVNHSTSYTFEASENDAESRFKIMFGTTGVEENGAQMFVFQSGSNLIISGEGTVQIIDMMGRVLRTVQVESNATVSTEGLTAGTYVVRMLTANGVQTQKVIVK